MSLGGADSDGGATQPDAQATRLEGLNAPSVLNTGWWSSLSFSWAAPLLQLGRQRQLQQGDLFLLPPELEPRACGQLLWAKWQQVKRKAHVADFPVPRLHNTNAAVAP